MSGKQSRALITILGFFLLSAILCHDYQVFVYPEYGRWFNDVAPSPIGDAVAAVLTPLGRPWSQVVMMVIQLAFLFFLWRQLIRESRAREQGCVCQDIS